MNTKLTKKDYAICIENTKWRIEVAKKKVQTLENYLEFLTKKEKEAEE